MEHRNIFAPPVAHLFRGGSVSCRLGSVPDGISKNEKGVRKKLLTPRIKPHG
ncbi:MAG: hypothetical protein JXA92_00825 [candidate division Zixibacteria bacterium]|nr:hypothetical protein [candidate division Zixibacteria bacterium]